MICPDTFMLCRKGSLANDDNKTIKILHLHLENAVKVVVMPIFLKALFCCKKISSYILSLGTYYKH